MVYVTAWACWKGYHLLKNDQGWFQRGDCIFAGMCVPEIQFNKGRDNLNMSHTNTHTQNITLLPLICHLCAFQQKTFLQDRTGHWELWDLQGLCLHHLQVRVYGRVLLWAWISAYLSLVLHVSTESAVRVSVHSYVHHAVILNHISFWSSVLLLGRIVVLLCVTAQPDAALWVWPLIAQTPLQVWSRNTVIGDLLRLITHTLSHALSLRFNEVNNNTDLSRAPVCPLGSLPPPLLFSFFYSPYLSFTHTDAHSVKYTNTHTRRVTA